LADTSTKSRTDGGRRHPEQPAILVAGCHFFTVSAPLAAGTGDKELPGLASLALEADSPFADEQLARGYFAAPQADGLLVFAALRRKFAADQECWAKAGFVVPDFATWLPRGGATSGVVILESDEAVTALDYAPGAALPRRIVSRPVPAEPPGADGVALAREQVLARVDLGGRRVWRYRLGEVPCTVKGGRYLFHWEAQGFVAEKSDDAASLSAAQLWAMDLRDPEFLRVRRRDFQWNRRAWGALVGLGAAVALLAVAEVGLLGARVLLASRQSRIRAQTPVAQRAEAESDIVGRLGGYIDRKPQPLELLACVNDLRPRAIYFTKVSVEGGLQMVIDASTSSLAVVNEFEAALRASPALASVEVKNTRAREGGGTFQLSLAFRSGFAAAAKPVPEEPRQVPPGSAVAVRPPRQEPPPSVVGPQPAMAAAGDPRRVPGRSSSSAAPVRARDPGMPSPGDVPAPPPDTDNPPAPPAP
jgi:hypothetical protein